MAIAMFFIPFSAESKEEGGFNFFPLPFSHFKREMYVGTVQATLFSLCPGGRHALPLPHLNAEVYIRSVKSVGNPQTLNALSKSLALKHLLAFKIFQNLKHILDFEYFLNFKHFLDFKQFIEVERFVK